MTYRQHLRHSFLINLACSLRVEAQRADTQTEAEHLNVAALRVEAAAAVVKEPKK